MMSDIREKVDILWSKYESNALQNGNSLEDSENILVSEITNIISDNKSEIRKDYETIEYISNMLEDVISSDDVNKIWKKNRINID